MYTLNVHSYKLCEQPLPTFFRGQNIYGFALTPWSDEQPSAPLWAVGIGDVE